MKKRKILYVTQPAFLDFDLPLIKRLSTLIDLTVLIKIGPLSRARTIFNIGDIKLKQGVSKLSVIQDYLSIDFKEYLDVNNTYIYNTNHSSAKHPINILYQFKVYAFITSNKFDVIHTNGHLGLNMILPVFDRKIIKILNIHDPFPHTGEVIKFDEWSKKLNIKYASKYILFNNTQLKHFIFTHKLKSEDVIYAPIGVYETYIKLALSENSLNKIPIKFLFFGRIIPYKGIEYLIKACEILLKEGYFIECTIAGSGKVYFKDDFIHESPNIKLVNRYIPEEELADLINSSHAVVCPYTDATQSGVVMTSYAFKKPVIGTKTGGLQEMIIDGKTGYLATPKDAVDLSVVMKKFIENYNNISFDKNIEKYFYSGPLSWDKAVKGIMDIYRNI